MITVFQEVARAERRERDQREEREQTMADCLEETTTTDSDRVIDECSFTANQVLLIDFFELSIFFILNFIVLN